MCIRDRYDDIDLQHAIAQEHWYVCGYKMNMKHPNTEETHHLFHDADPSTPMFRVVVKANLSMPMADNLVASIAKSFEFLDAHGAGGAKRSDEETERREELGFDAG